jgi:hypothetical protein
VQEVVDNLTFGSNALEVIFDAVRFDIGVGMLRRADESGDPERRQGVFDRTVETITTLPLALGLLLSRESVAHEPRTH